MLQVGVPDGIPVIPELPESISAAFRADRQSFAPVALRDEQSEADRQFEADRQSEMDRRHREDVRSGAGRQMAVIDSRDWPTLSVGEFLAGHRRVRESQEAGRAVV